MSISEYINMSDSDDSESSDDEVMFAVAPALCLTKFRAPAEFRKRWDCKYLVNLAIRERSFKRENRMEPREFTSLHELLVPRLTVNQEMARLAMSRAGSAPISSASRLACALILLGGGRITGVMRTHGVSRSFAYENFRYVIRAINADQGYQGAAVKCFLTVFVEFLARRVTAQNWLLIS